MMMAAAAAGQKREQKSFPLTLGFVANSCKLFFPFFIPFLHHRPSSCLLLLLLAIMNKKKSSHKPYGWREIAFAFLQTLTC